MNPSENLVKIGMIFHLISFISQKGKMRMINW